MPYSNTTNNLTRDTLRKVSVSKKYSDNQKELATLKIAYSEDSKLLTGYINKLVNIKRIYPRHLPTQASLRWSTIDPPITNWPRACINQACQQRLRELYDIDDTSYGYIEHEWDKECWSVRDILIADPGYIMVTWDHDNIEGKIHDLIVNDTEAILAHEEGLDLHTITCCNIFGYSLPYNLINPHTACDCHLLQSDEQGKVVPFTIGHCLHCQWRKLYNWQGKDTKQRVLSKNFNHGSKYATTHRFVHAIKDIEQYGVTYKQLELLAKRYIASKKDAWQVKLDIMQQIRKDRLSRSLYGCRRVFFDSSEETGREGFSHMISATVSHYNNETLILLDKWFGDDCILLHNAHDGDKLLVRATNISSDVLKESLKYIIERPITYNNRTLTMTAGVKVYA